MRIRVLALILMVAATAIAQQPAHGSRESIFLEAWRITNNAFYDAGMNGADWEAVRDELLPKARAAETDAELSAIINDALSRLHASHTGHYTKDRREYYEILDIFYPDGIPARRGSAIQPGPAEYIGIGLAAREVDGHTFAADVYKSGPADEAGILAGDELIGVEDGPWGDIVPFRGREGKPTRITIQRTPDESSRTTLTVTPKRIRPRALFLAAIDASAAIIESGGKKVAYARITSYAHPDYHDKLKDLIQSKFKDADGLIIDIRGGWGGASPQYMDIFNPYAPVLEHTRRGEESKATATTWRKPVALLVDHGTRSGKEAITYAFKKHHVGLIIGETTAGAVLGGTPRPLSDGSILLLAVTDVTVDGIRLEGVGVTPDIIVERKLPYAAGRDPQRDLAVEAVAKQCR